MSNWETWDILLRYLPRLFAADATPEGGRCLVYDECSLEDDECWQLARLGLVEMKRGSNDNVAVRLTPAGVEAYKALRARDGWTYKAHTHKFVKPCLFCGTVGALGDRCCRVDLPF